MKTINHCNSLDAKPKAHARISTLQAGFSLTELMIAIAIGLLITTTLIALFVKVNRTNDEMAKTNSQIENGRFTIQLLQDDISHAGFWGSFVPQFDDLTLPAIPPNAVAPADVPTDPLTNPCLAYSTPWTANDITNLIGIPVQVYGDTPPSGTGCVTNLATNKKANTDVLVVRHVELCVPGAGNCEADTAGKLYFQSSLCEDEISSTVRGVTATTITLDTFSSTTNDFYKGLTIRILSGPGAGQTRLISAYDGSTKIATLAPAPALPWATPMPDLTSKYTFGFGYLLGTTGFNLFHKRDCTTVAEKRKFISNIYYVRDYATTVGDGIPTLMLSQFDLAGGTLAHQAAVPLIEGVEGFKVELGIDSISDSGNNIITNAANSYTAAITWADTKNLTSPTNRGDGVPDGAFVKCTDAVPCTADQLANTVAVKLYVLARADKITAGYTDNKTYALGSTTLGPYNDGYKRHVFSTTVRLNNISARRETPP